MRSPVPSAPSGSVFFRANTFDLLIIDGDLFVRVDVTDCDVDSVGIFAEPRAEIWGVAVADEAGVVATEHVAVSTRVDLPVRLKHVTSMRKQPPFRGSRWGRCEFGQAAYFLNSVHLDT